MNVARMTAGMRRSCIRRRCYFLCRPASLRISSTIILRRKRFWVATSGNWVLIHFEKNGSSEGWIETRKGIIALNADTFVPGHGDLRAKADLQKRLMAAQERRAKIKELVAQGKSLDEVKAALGESTTPPAAAPGPCSFRASRK